VEKKRVRKMKKRKRSGGGWWKRNRRKDGGGEGERKGDDLGEEGRGQQEGKCGESLRRGG